jgi:hypothetical protein
MAHVGGRILRDGAFLAALVATAGCGSSFTGSTSYPSLLEPDQPRSPTSTVTIRSSGVDPVVLHRDYPVTVTFTNNDTVSHTFESAPELGWDDCPEMHNLAAVKPGRQLVVVFSEKDAVCVYHEVSQPGNVAFQGYVAIH